jgi:hypothetical protein
MGFSGVLNKRQDDGKSRIVIVGLTTLPSPMSRLSRQCEVFNISEAYRPPRPVTEQPYVLLLVSNS